jgi:hypothetical protein
VSPRGASQWRELARRTGNGVEASLLWNESVSRLKVTVSDGRLCHHLDFELAGNPVSAFQGPFADATSSLSADDVSDEFWGFNPSRN